VELTLVKKRLNGSHFYYPVLHAIYFALTLSRWRLHIASRPHARFVIWRRHAVNADENKWQQILAESMQCTKTFLFVLSLPQK